MKANSGWSYARDIEHIGKTPDKMSREDIATALEALVDTLKDFRSDFITGVKEVGRHYVWVIAETPISNFDIIGFLNDHYAGKGKLTTVNIKMICPKNLSRGLLTQEDIDNADYVDENEVNNSNAQSREDNVKPINDEDNSYSDNEEYSDSGNDGQIADDNGTDILGVVDSSENGMASLEELEQLSKSVQEDKPKKQNKPIVENKQDIVQRVQNNEWKLYSFSQSAEFIIDDHGIIIGRSSKSSELPIRNPQLSKKHARIYVKNGKCYIHDFSSTNGTYVDGVKVPPNGDREVLKGSKLNLGGEIFEVR